MLVGLLACTGNRSPSAGDGGSYAGEGDGVSTGTGTMQTSICDSGFAVNVPGDVCAACLGEGCCGIYSICFAEELCHDCTAKLHHGPGCRTDALLAAATKCKIEQCKDVCPLD